MTAPEVFTMSQPIDPNDSVSSQEPRAADLIDCANRLKKEAAALAVVASALRKGSSGPLQKVLGRIGPVLDAEALELVAGVRRWLEAEPRNRRHRLATELRNACVDRGIELIVLGREPLEIRLCPVSAHIDVDANKVEIRFADQPLARGDATAESIMKARQKALDLLEARAWDPQAFHGQLREAWKRGGGESTRWVEVSDVLPELTLLLQGRKFRRDPSARNFEPYPKARFAYDLWRLRRDQQLSQNGWRLTLAPATGSSTKDKSRVIRLEDASGQGQYHLQLAFIREESSHDAPSAST
jgi:hypothetical protein